MNKEIFNLPNCLTMTRILAAPFVVFLLYLEMWFQFRIGSYCAFGVYFLACMTDYFDGRIARSQNIITTLGKFLDPLADKLLIGSVFIMLVRLGPEWKVPAWIVIIIICRELAVTGMRAIAAEMGQVVAADKYGKAKTLAQSLAGGFLIFHYPLWGWDPRPIGQGLLWLALVLTVFSGGNYLYNFYKKWLKSTEN
ncbi:CDP-diacylglycerol--glycerol-3-phosphate 3-phosphatidyltransferase [Pseudodesulfovibrio piezophilus]|uniref:CDP-diacylglycerol--glycerol-3-phosphate 3-phosphatidyltransferase n=1 Tax=Pseudodesulfovibrio piezophilus (strain DSM 21447 / JCM 15486 / C1TLV30) TaxID=1322246 RepID=M1WLB0_PSEP2|nr:CDP-diacylglycerol--glycerol-3-phosphate 3-phosphatidyltransferase [Pseudodesulfovibrio piezophilus]CCH47550.1 CDP-diacylglycerol--glycerol-3-phosphate 3-phosphatidyltransferase [Pseudodesulfovibrio piezophilus C1TLV30]